MTCVALTPIEFIDQMNHTYRVGFPKYQKTENPKYQKSKVPNTTIRPYIFVTRFLTGQDLRHCIWIHLRIHSCHYTYAILCLPRLPCITRDNASALCTSSLMQYTLAPDRATIPIIPSLSKRLIFSTFCSCSCRDAPRASMLPPKHFFSPNGNVFPRFLGIPLLVTHANVPRSSRTAGCCAASK